MISEMKGQSRYREGIGRYALWDIYKKDIIIYLNEWLNEIVTDSINWILKNKRANDKVSMKKWHIYSAIEMNKLKLLIMNNITFNDIITTI